MIGVTSRSQNSRTRSRTSISAGSSRSSRAEKADVAALLTGRTLPAAARSPPFEEAAQEGGLPGVLQVVADDAEQPDAQGDRRVPAPVDDPVEVAGGQRAQELGGPGVHVGVVVHEQLRVGDLCLPDVLAAEAVA